MTTHHAVTLPLSEEVVRGLAVGDSVTLSGEIVMTAGLPTHQRIQDHITRGVPLPVDLAGAALFHLGSYSDDDGGVFRVRYINPTTSTRFNPFMPTFIRQFALRAVGGKGGLDRASAEAMRQVGCVYLSFLGGGCTLLSAAIREVVSVDWADLIPHYRLVRLRVEELGPLIVGIDAHGHSVYDDLQRDAAAKLPGLLDDLRIAREKAAAGGAQD